MKKIENDIHTSTVDGAEGYENKIAKQEWVEEQNEIESDEIEDEQDDEDDCNCSDPGCPCGGSKKGRL